MLKQNSIFLKYIYKDVMLRFYIFIFYILENNPLYKQE